MFKRTQLSRSRGNHSDLIGPQLARVVIELLRSFHVCSFPFATMSGMEAYGYAGAAVAVVFFGSNYVPVKKYPTGDGMIFQWVFIR